MALATETKKLFHDRYEILALVGRGSRSVVYRARISGEEERDVALKVLLHGPDKHLSRERLRAEALAMATCRHQFVVKIHDFHSLEDICYISMEYAPLGDLRRFSSAQAGEKLPVRTAEQFFFQALEALHFVHSVGIIHRDLKPDNILVVGQEEIRVADFGVAALPGDNVSTDDLKRAIGSLNYMAPEILDGERCDERSDLYSLALSFYEMLSGYHPFEGAPIAKQLEIRREQHLESVSSLAPTLSFPVARAIMRCLHYDPDKRYSHARLVLEELRALTGPVSISTSIRHKLLDETVSKTATQPQTPNDSAEPDTVIKRPLDRPNHREMHQNDNHARVPHVEGEPESPMANNDDRNRPPYTGGAPHSGRQPRDREPGNEEVSNNPDLLRASRAKTEFISHDLIQQIRHEHEPTPQERAGFGQPIQRHPGSGKTDPYRLDTGNPLPHHHAQPPHEHLGYGDYDPSMSGYPPGVAPSRKRAVRLIVFLVGIAFAFLVLYPLRSSIVGSGSKSETPGESPAEPIDSRITLPSYSGQPLQFPQLPQGVFVGTIEGLLPQRTIPLTFLSLKSGTEIACILGIDGFRPSTVPTQGLESGTLRVAGNGLILQFIVDKESTQKDALTGSVTNLVTGERGRWSISPK